VTSFARWIGRSGSIEIGARALFLAGPTGSDRWSRSGCWSSCRPARAGRAAG
jgi:hypothetical protein